MDFADLYACYAQDVFRFALFLSGRRELAEDIAAETFARTWPRPLSEHQSEGRNRRVLSRGQDYATTVVTELARILLPK